MKTLLKTGFLALAIAVSGNAAAQENTQANTNLLHYYDSDHTAIKPLPEMF